MNSVTDGLGTVFSSIHDWAKQPFQTQMDAWHWALFVGLILVLSFTWHLVLRDLKGVA